MSEFWGILVLEVVLLSCTITVEAYCKCSRLIYWNMSESIFNLDS